MAVTDPDLKTQPTGELVRRLIDDVQALIDKQVQLVKQELHEELRQVLGAAKSLGIGAGLLLMALICFFNLLFLAIDTFLPRWGWLAALVYTLVFAIVGMSLAMRGKDQVKVEPLARTRATLKEDAEWAKHRLTPNGKSSLSETTPLEPSRS